MVGTRLPDVERATREGWERWCQIRDGRFETIAAPGTYMRVTRKADDSTWCWYLRAPNGDVATIAWPSEPAHKVVEHEDGTITVTPSIVFPGGWHGFLTAGIWTP